MFYGVFALKQTDSYIIRQFKVIIQVYSLQALTVNTKQQQT